MRICLDLWGSDLENQLDWTQVVKSPSFPPKLKRHSSQSCLQYYIAIIHSYMYCVQVKRRYKLQNMVQCRFRIIIIIINIYYQSRRRRRLIINAGRRRADDIANPRLRETTSTSTSGRTSHQPTNKRKRPVMLQRSNVTKRSTTVRSAELDAHYGVSSKTAMFRFYWNSFNILFNIIWQTTTCTFNIFFLFRCPHSAAL